MKKEWQWGKAQKKPIIVKWREVSADGEIIDTLEGQLKANSTEHYIIHGVEGEEYPIDKRIFYKTYDIVENPPLPKITREIASTPDQEEKQE